MTAQTQEVAVQEQAGLPAVQSMQDLGMSAKDVLIPQLHLLQPTSEKVGQDQGKVGDIMDLQSGEVLGSVAKPLEIAVVKMYKVWTVYDATSQPAKFLRTEPMTPQNEDRAWDGKDPDGTPLRLDYTINFFVVTRADLKAGTPDIRHISFKRTSLGAGRKIASQMFRLNAMKQNPFGKSVVISVTKEQKEKNTYAVYQMASGTALTPEELAVLKDAQAFVANVKVQVQQAPTDDARAAAAKEPVVLGASEGDTDY